jgi:predicted metal-binding protein
MNEISISKTGSPDIIPAPEKEWIEKTFILANEMNIDIARYFSPGLLKIDRKIFDKCKENACGQFKKNHMCPPYTGTLSEIELTLLEYRHGIVFQKRESLDPKTDLQATKKTKIDFHYKIIELENFIHAHDRATWGFIASYCELCTPCTLFDGLPCRFPELARTSLEGILVDVADLLEKIGIENAFYADKVHWTGAVLFK